MQHQVIFFCDLKSFLLHLATHECLDFQKERKESCKFKRDKVSPKHKLHHTCRTNHIPQCAGATRAARCSYTGKLGKARVVRVLYPGCWVPGCFTLGAPTPTPSKAPTCTQNGSHLILLSKCALRLSPHARHPISAGMLACWYYH